MSRLPSKRYCKIEKWIALDFYDNLQTYTTEKMFKLSEKFFVELGLDKMTDKFWKNSVFDKPKNIEMVWYVLNHLYESWAKNWCLNCSHASAWDYDSKQNDFRFVSNQKQIIFDRILKIG